MKVPKYYIFSGYSGTRDALFVDAVEGLGPTNDRMKALAAEHPGPYFVFCIETHKVLASIDTSKSQFKAHRESA